MPSGLFVGDCASSGWAWLDIGCDVQNAGSSLGSTITNLLEPVWIILAVAVVILLILAFAPNVPKIIPHLSFV